MAHAPSANSETSRTARSFMMNLIGAKSSPLKMQARGRAHVQKEARVRLLGVDAPF
ncbi:hypothetical protein D3C83_115360 [compost metagenome]